MAYIGRQLSAGNYLKLDDLSGSFNGSTTTFNLTAGGQPYYPGSAYSILVSLSGVVQEPIASYTLDGNQITFATAPSSTDDFFCIVLGTALGVGVPADGTVSGSKLTTPFNYDSGLLYLDSTNNRVGIGTTLPQQTLHVVGSGSTTLLVSGNARVTGILTVGSSSVTLDGNNNQVNVGTGVTISSSSFLIGSSSLHSTGLNVTNINATGVGTFASLSVSGNVSIAGTVTYDDVTNVDSIGIVTARSGVRITDGGLVVTAGVSTFNNNVVVSFGSSVGIGTIISSNRVLDVFGPSRFTANTSVSTLSAQFDGSTGTYTTWLYNGNPVGDIGTGNVVISGLSTNSFAVSSRQSQPLVFGTNLSERARIDAGGRLGIGTTNPTSLLHLYGNGPQLNAQAITGESQIRISSTGGNYRRIIFFDSAVTPTKNNFQIAEQEVDNSLHIGPSTAVGGLTFSNTTGLVVDSSGNILIGAAASTGTASQPLQVTGGAYVSGSVGIGTTNPTQKLQVLADESSTFQNSTTPNTGTSSVNITNISGDAKLTLQNDDRVSAGLGTLANNGSQLVFGGKYDSSIPTANLSFGAVGAYKENNTSANQQGYLSLYTRPSAGNLVERVRIDSSGNLGIGTTNPTTKLDVFVNGGEGLPANVTGERMRVISNDVVGRSGFLSIIAGSSAYSGVFFGDKDAADVGKIRYYHADNSLQFLVNGTTEAFRATSSGNVLIGSATSTGTASQNLQVTGGAYISGSVGIATTNPQYTLHVVGSFAATTKSFVIDHPTKTNHKLRYASLEGPENSVYVRGRTIENVIKLPDYWTGLVDENSITVNLTPIGNKNVWVEEINNNKVYINSNSTIDCFYIVFAERKDVEKLVVEIPES